MSEDVKSLAFSSGALALVFVGSIALSSPAAAACTGPGAPTTTQTRCIAAIPLPKPLQGYDISWVNAQRAEFYLADRSNAAIDIIDTEHLRFKRSLGQGLFRGIIFNATGTAADNAHSGPNGVVTRGRWVYTGDGDSTLKVFDLDSPAAAALKASVSTGGTTRLDEMALTNDGRLLLAANNAEDPPFATLFRVNGDDATNSVGPGSILQKTLIDSTIVPKGFGLSIEQPAWDPKTRRFYTSVPIIANNPTGCDYGQGGGGAPCSGGLLVTDPLHPKAVEGAFDPATNTGVVKLINCGPNGATTADFDVLLLGCTPANLPGSTTSTVISAKTRNQTSSEPVMPCTLAWMRSGSMRVTTATTSPPTGRQSPPDLRSVRVRSLAWST